VILPLKLNFLLAERHQRVPLFVKRCRMRHL
jgi:hypothetical protein